MAATRGGSREGDTEAAEKARAAPVREREHREFVSEVEEILEHMFEDVGTLQEQRGSGREVDPELVHRLFRWAHSLKGLAGMFGLDAMGGLAHRLEDILDGLRLGRIPFDSPGLDLLEEGVSLLATLLARFRGDERVGGGRDDREAVRDYVQRIDEALFEPPGEAAEEGGVAALDPAVLRALTEYEEHRLRENLRLGRRLVLVDSTFEIARFEEGLTELSSALREVGEVISTLPSSGDVPESRIRFSLLVGTEMGVEPLRERLDLSAADVLAVRAPTDVHGAPSAVSSPPVVASGEGPSAVGTDASGEGATADERPSEEPCSVEPQPSGRPERSTPKSPGPAPRAPEERSLRTIAESVRVDIRKLDELMNLVGELILERNAIAHVASQLAADPRTRRVASDLARAHKALERKLGELQTGVLAVRMVPLRQVFDRLSRVARRLRRDLDKDVALEFHGSETELDKLIVEQLVDPLAHLLRNAFDHAIEPAPERVRSGKPPRGRITIRATQRGNHVVLEIEDDGRGLDVEALLRRGREGGWIATDVTPTRKELLALVFEPGFSTRAEVGETSGRGVGMDVVRSNLEGLGGSVELASSEGHGTIVTITLPITLAIIQSLIVGVGPERFAIPLNSILETLRVEPDRILRVEGREILDLRGEPLPLRRLADEFELESPIREARPFVVVLALGEQRLGLIVDRLEGQQDTVIKPIQGPLRRIRGIAGATELADRGAILVVDVAALVGGAARRKEAA